MLASQLSHPVSPPSAPAEGVDTALAFDLDGKQIWKPEFGVSAKHKHMKLGTSSNASPITDGKGVFVYFKSGTFAALELDGKIRWKQERNYKVPAENDQGYTTPIPIRHGDRDALLAWCSDHLTAYAADDGSLLWSCGGFNPKSKKLWPPIATPVVAGDLALVPVGRDNRKQAEVHAVRLGGKGDVTKTHRVWDTDETGQGSVQVVGEGEVREGLSPIEVGTAVAAAPAQIRT